MGCRRCSCARLRARWLRRRQRHRFLTGAPRTLPLLMMPRRGMRRLCCVAPLLLTAACAAGPDGMVGSSFPPEAQLAPPPDCLEFTRPVPIAGEWRDAAGQACRQPDGSWNVVESVPGGPPQIYTLPPDTVWMTPEQAQQAAWLASYPPPWSWAGSPSLFAGSFFVVHGFHHRAHFDDRRRHRREPMAMGHHGTHGAH